MTFHGEMNIEKDDHQAPKDELDLDRIAQQVQNLVKRVQIFITR